MVVLAIALYAANRGSERPFRWWSTLILALTGLVFFWGNPPRHVEPMLSVVLAGAWLFVHGVCTLLGYLRANPWPRAPEGVRV
jgi:hypothetical protein